MKTLFLFITLVLSCAVSAQKIIINGEETNRKLTWNDFTGEVDRNSPYAAFTKWNLKFKFSGSKFNGESATINNFEVTLSLDPENSWVRKNQETDNLLTHEQGHFNLGILCMNEVLQTYKKTYFTKNDYLSQLQNLVITTIKKYNDLGLKYDEETAHGRNKEEQEKWNIFFDKQLAS